MVTNVYSNKVIGEKKIISPLIFLWFFILAYTIMPVVSQLVSLYLTTYVYMLIVLLVSIIIIIRKKEQLLNYYLSLLMPFIGYIILTYFVKSDSFFLWGYKSLLFIFPILLGDYFFNHSFGKKENNILIKIIVIALGITIITTIVGLKQYPGASRELATITDSEDSNSILYNLKNIGGYEFVYTLVLLYPLVILAYKKRKINFLITLFCIIGVFTVIIYSEYTIAFLLVSISSLLFIIKKNIKKSELIILIIFAILLLIFFSSIFSDFLKFLASKIDSYTIKTRLIALSYGKSGLESSEDNRIIMYRKSLNSFLENPVFGSFLDGGKNIGGHSFLLDCLAQYGIVGLFLIVLMYGSIYKYFFKKYSKENGFGYLFWCFFQTILLSLINTGMWLNVLCLFIPIFAKGIFEKDS